MAVDLEVGTNSYISVADADAYFNERLYSSSWDNATADDKARALIMATKAIDRQPLKGIKDMETQTLAFPRYDPSKYLDEVEYSNEDLVIEAEVPQIVLDAVCEEALALLDRGDDQRAKLQQAGVKSFSLGSLSESYASGSGRGLTSQQAKELMRPWLGGAVYII